MDVKYLSELSVIGRYNNLLDLNLSYGYNLTNIDQIERPEHMSAYLYTIVNTINNRLYVGIRVLRKNERMCDYQGSSKFLSRSITKNGPENFNKHIICWASTTDDIFSIERDIVCKDFIKLSAAKYDLVFNRSIGGRMGQRPRGMYKCMKNLMTDDTCYVHMDDVDIFKSDGYSIWSHNQGKSYMKHKVSGSGLYVDKLKIQEFIDNDYELYSWTTGVKLSTEQRKKISIKTKESLKDPAKRKKISDAGKRRTSEQRKQQGETLSKTWKTNKNGATDKLSASVTKYYDDPKSHEKTSIATKKAMSDPEIRRKCGSMRDKIWMFKDDRSIGVISEDIGKYLENGWDFGRYFNEKHKWMHDIDDVYIGSMVTESNWSTYLSNGWSFGRPKSHLVSVTNDIVNVMVHDDQVNEYVDLGWRLGQRRRSDFTFVYNDNTCKKIDKSEIDHHLVTGWKLTLHWKSIG